MSPRSFGHQDSPYRMLYEDWRYMLRSSVLINSLDDDGSGIDDLELIPVDRANITLTGVAEHDGEFSGARTRSPKTTSPMSASPEPVEYRHRGRSLNRGVTRFSRRSRSLSLATCCRNMERIQLYMAVAVTLLTAKLV